MMVTAFMFSSCSTSDAFIARSFLGLFPLNAIMGFLIFGPMMDIKNILMLLPSFGKGFVIKISLIIFIFNFLMIYFIMPLSLYYSNRYGFCNTCANL